MRGVDDLIMGILIRPVGEEVEVEVRTVAFLPIGEV